MDSDDSRGQMPIDTLSCDTIAVHSDIERPFNRIQYIFVDHAPFRSGSITSRSQSTFPTPLTLPPAVPSLRSC